METIDDSAKVTKSLNYYADGFTELRQNGSGPLSSLEDLR